MPSGRPRIYNDDDDRPIRFLLQMPHDLAVKLRRHAASNHCTMTALLLEGLDLRLNNAEEAS